MDQYFPYNLRELNLDSLLQLLSQPAPWWIYLLAALIPLSLFVAFRELACWFWKLNRIVRSLERIEARLAALEAEHESSKDLGPPMKLDEPYKL